ncbi:MAG TPA: hypothetical protein VLL52_17845, partial [Anaerolineae bacterium]|nr:hypothetical protein [Anaerolineae bacterium]
MSLDWAEGFQVGKAGWGWGVTMVELKEAWAGRPRLKSYGGWPNVRIVGEQTYGLPVLVVEGRGPAEDRPVLGVHYSLAGPAVGQEKAAVANWGSMMQRMWGQPTETDSWRPLGEGKRSSYVIGRMLWRWPTVEVNFSVFGGRRETEAGAIIGAVMVDWVDELVAGAPYVAELERRQVDLERLWGGRVPLGERFRLSWEMKRWLMLGSEGQPTAALYAAQRALYRRGLLLTPQVGAGRLGDDEVL